jgi:hypothetical protein
MRVAFVKHALEPHGPWRTVKFEENGLEFWPSKVTFWSPTVRFKADWYVVDCAIPWSTSHYGHICRDEERVELMHRYTQGVMSPDDVPVEEYDVVIGLYPWVKPRGDALFTYMIQEHWDQLFIDSCGEPMEGYDLHLDFMYGSLYEVTQLPQSVAFPFPKWPARLRRTVEPFEKDDAAWIDGRVLLALIDKKLWNAEAEKAAEDMSMMLGVPLRYKADFWRTAFGLADPPLWGDSLDYLKGLASCKYYISTGRTHAPGEAVCDAAALGCICIGDYNKLYHRLVCHPLCMVGDNHDLKAVAWQVFDSPDLQRAALAHQGKALRKHFRDHPLGVLRKALELKGRANG